MSMIWRQMVSAASALLFLVLTALMYRLRALFSNALLNSRILELDWWRLPATRLLRASRNLFFLT